MCYNSVINERNKIKMAIPKTLKELDETKAMKIINKNTNGYWEGVPFNSDFIYGDKMIRVNCICGKRIFECGKIAM